MNWKTSIAAAAALIIGASCAVESADEPVETETAEQSLGESTTAFYFNGNGAGVMPTREERVANYLLQRFRMTPYVFGLEDMDGNPIPPTTPMQYQPFMAEAGRWMGNHALENACYCPQDPMNAPEASWNTCCDVQEVNGEVRCVGPVLECDDENATTEEERWDLLNRGPGNIQSEAYATAVLPLEGTAPGELMSLGALGAFPQVSGAILINTLGSLLNTRYNAIASTQTSNVIVPQECREPTSSCTPNGGTCVLDDGSASCEIGANEDNPDCIGACDGGTTAGQACTVPEPLDPEVCDPETYERGFYFTYAYGQTREPEPVLRDGVATQLGLTASDDQPNGFYGLTPAGEIEFGIIYYEPSGPPQSIQAVTGNNCIDLTKWDQQRDPDYPILDPENDAGMADAGTDPDAGMMEEEEPYVGLIFTETARISEPGCMRYYFTSTDNQGLTYTYPDYGSLGLEIDSEGNAVLGGSPNCPVWAPERTTPSCIPQGDQCDEGDERPCYTGRPGTQDRGICDRGTESCANGRWSGICDGQTLPEPEDTCGNQTDDDCNGFVDENCPITPGNNDTNNDTPDAGMPDMGDDGDDMGSTEPPADKGGEDDGCCTTVEGSTPDTPLAGVLALLVALFFIRRR